MDPLARFSVARRRSNKESQGSIPGMPGGKSMRALAAAFFFCRLSRRLTLCFFSAPANRVRGDLHVALVGLQGVGAISVQCRVTVDGQDTVLLDTPWSSKSDQQSWNEPQVALVRCTQEVATNGTVVIHVSTAGKGLQKKARLGEARLSVAEATQKASSRWLDIDVGGAASGADAKGGSRVGRGSAPTAGNPQILVKLLYVSLRSGANSTQFLERRRALLGKPLPEKLTDVVKDLRPNGAASAAPSDGALAPRSDRTNSILFEQETSIALKRMSRTSASRRPPQPASALRMSSVTAADRDRMEAVAANEKLQSSAPSVYHTKSMHEDSGSDNDGDTSNAYRPVTLSSAGSSARRPTARAAASDSDDDQEGNAYRAVTLEEPSAARPFADDSDSERKLNAYMVHAPEAGSGARGGDSDSDDENAQLGGYTNQRLKPSRTASPRNVRVARSASPVKSATRQAHDDDDEDDSSDGPGAAYKPIVTADLEAEMDSVVEKTLPVQMRGRANSNAVPINPEWRDMDSFNSRFQAAVEIMNVHGAQSNTRRMELINSCLTVIRLAQDFATLASQYGKTIISEHALPESKQTIKPRKELGGVLGGQKYIVLGILFKFAGDDKGLFRSLPDPLEAANKIAGRGDE